MLVLFLIEKDKENKDLIQKMILITQVMIDKLKEKLQKEKDKVNIDKRNMKIEVEVLLENYFKIIERIVIISNLKISIRKNKQNLN